MGTHTMNQLLTNIFRDKPPDDHILIWTLPGKLSTWFTSPDDIPSVDPHIIADVYFGVGASPRDFGPRGRCKSALVTGVGSLWLDVDILSPVHKKQNLPPTQEEAKSILAQTFPPYSFLVDSGHGLQAYWILQDWFKIDSPQSATLIQTVLTHHNTAFRRACAARGYDADSVSDLARVMRLPGTTNWKDPLNPAPVTLLYEADPHIVYPLSAFVPNPPTRPDHSTAWTPALLDKFNLQAEVDNRLRPTWNMSRADMADTSPSAYMIALGRLLHLAAWTDNDVSSAMEAFRSHHNLDPKPHAISFTMQKIKSTPSGAPPTKSTPATNPPDMAAVLGFKVLGLVRYNSNPPTFKLTIDDHPAIQLGPIDTLTDQRRFRNTIAADIGILPVKLPGAQWDTLVRALLSTMTHETIGEESTDAGQVHEWLQTYLSAVTIHETPYDGLTAAEPWTHQGSTHITTTALRSWLAINLQDRISTKQLAVMLKTIGAEPCQFNNGSGKRNAWKLP